MNYRYQNSEYIENGLDINNKLTGMYEVSNSYKQVDKYWLDFKNIESEDVVFVFLDMMDQWLRKILMNIPKKERIIKLERFLYRWNIWTETNLEMDNQFYLYDMLTDMSVSSNTSELFVNFKKLYCIFTKCSCEGSLDSVYEGDLASVYLSEFINLIVKNLNKMSIFCEYRNMLLDSEKFENLFSSIAKNSSRSFMGNTMNKDSNNYNKMDIIFRSNEKVFEEFYGNIVEMAIALRMISNEMRGDIEMIHSIATIVLERGSSSSDISKRDIELFLKGRDRVYMGTDKHLKSVFLNKSISNVIDSRIVTIQKSLKGLAYPPVENMYRILSETILIPPKLKGLKDGQNKVIIDRDELRKIFIRMYQSPEIRGDILESFLSDYVSVCIEYKNSDLYKNRIEPRINDTYSKVNMYTIDNSCVFTQYIESKIKKRGI